MANANTYHKEENKKSTVKAFGFSLGLIACCMFMFSYALIPIYNIICGKFASNGKLGEPAFAPSNKAIDYSREIKMQFINTNYQNLNLTFNVVDKNIKIHPNQNSTVKFTLTNNSDNPVTIRTMPSVSPGVAGRYFKRIECFCFHIQTLMPHKVTPIELHFYLDDKMPKDINTMTVSYSFYPVVT